MKRPKDVYRDLPFFLEVKLLQANCHVCHMFYEVFTIGSNHVHAVCKKCNRSDEVGLVFYK